MPPRSFESLRKSLAAGPLPSRALDSNCLDKGDPLEAHKKAIRPEGFAPPPHLLGGGKDRFPSVAMGEEIRSGHL